MGLLSQALFCGAVCREELPCEGLPGPGGLLCHPPHLRQGVPPAKGGGERRKLPGMRPWGVGAGALLQREEGDARGRDPAKRAVESSPLAAQHPSSSAGSDLLPAPRAHSKQRTKPRESRTNALLGLEMLSLAQGDVSAKDGASATGSAQLKNAFTPRGHHVQI